MKSQFTLPPWQQSLAEFRASSLVLFVRKGQDGMYELGHALGGHLEECARQREALLAEYERRAAGKGAQLMESFERTLRISGLLGDVIVLSGHKAKGMHLILVTGVELPADGYARAYSALVTDAASRGDTVYAYVESSSADPREQLLSQRQSPSDAQLRALEGFARRRGRNWKSVLRLLWATGADEREEDGSLLRQVRNTLGPEWLTSFKVAK